jgi:peptidoglycan/LPS O-acetylase OafA/YrhL
VRVVHVAMNRIGWGHPLAAFAPTVALTVLAAWLSYRFVEMRFLTLKSRFARKPRAAMPVIEPVPAVSAKVAMASTNS